MKAKDVVMLLILSALWGGSFLFMRIGAPVLGPLVLIELRVLLAAITLMIFALVSRHRIRILRKWWHYLILGATNAIYVDFVRGITPGRRFSGYPQRNNAHVHSLSRLAMDKGSLYVEKVFRRCNGHHRCRHFGRRGF